MDRFFAVHVFNATPHALSPLSWPDQLHDDLVILLQGKLATRNQDQDGYRKMAPVELDTNPR